MTPNPIMGFGLETDVRLRIAAVRQEMAGLGRAMTIGQEPTFGEPLFDHPVGA